MPESTDHADPTADAPSDAATGPDRYDVAVIGAGPAGTAAALRAAELGASVVVLEAGRVVATGTHDELLEGSDTYREIVESQMAVEA